MFFYCLPIEFTLIYFINPADFIPDFVPFTGFADDFGITICLGATIFFYEHEYFL